MRAAVITAPRTLEVREVALPLPRPNEIRVKLEGCGVCASNVPPWEGREWFTYPMKPGALGHEAWGAVDALGKDVREFEVGQRVAILSDNAYAEYDVTQTNRAVHLPNELRGMPFPAEPLGCAMNIFCRSEVKAADTVAVVGIGFLGALLTKLCTSVGARVIAISRRPFSLEYARRFGAQHAVPMDDHWRIVEQVKQLTDGRFCDVVIECVGKEWPLNLSAS